MAVIQDIDVREVYRSSESEDHFFGEGALWLYNRFLKPIHTPRASWVTVYLYDKDDDLSAYTVATDERAKSKTSILYGLGENDLAVFAPFSWERFRSLQGNTRQKMIMDVAHNALVYSFQCLGWSTQELVDAYKEVVKAGYVFDRWYLKPKWNKSRTKRAGVWAVMDNDICRLSVRQIDRADNVFGDSLIFTMLPRTHALGTLTRTFHWVGNDTILVESNDRMVNDDYMLTYEVQVSAEVSVSLGHCPPELNYAKLSISCPVRASNAAAR